ncbi:ABC transporter substrate-binding protein [Streptomyces sp. NPDC001478]
MRTAFAPATAAAVAATLLLAGCSADPDTAPAAGSGTPVAGGTLTYVVGTDVLCVDPQQAGNGDELTAARGLVDSLTDQDPKTGKILPWLATSWEVSPDATRYTFRLRPGVTFSDGTPLDAAAVKANFDGFRALGARAVQAGTYLTGYRSATVVDAHTVRIEFSAPNVKFLQATSTVSLGVVAPASLRRSPGERCTRGVVGSGPFTLTRFTRNQQVRERAREGYAWGSARSGGKAAPYLSGLVIRIVPEEGVRAGGLRSGEFDATGAVSPQDERTLKSSGFGLSTRPSPGLVYGLNVNASRTATRDAAVRRALQKALDRKEIVDTVLSSGYRPASSVLASTTPAYTDLSARLATDPAGARKLLDGAGWKPGPDGIRTRDGERLNLVTVWFGGPGTVQTALELVQQQFKAVGVGLTLKPVPIAKALATFKAGDYDLILGNASTADPDILRNYYTAEGLDAVRLRPGPLLTALHAQAAEADPAARARLVATAQKLIVDEGYGLPLYESSTVLGLSPKVHGVTFDALSRPRFSGAWLG